MHLARRWRALVLAVGLLGAASAAAAHEEIRIFSSAPGGGRLVADFDFSYARTLPARLGFCPGGTCLYADGEPGLVAPASSGGDGLYPLNAGTEVSFVVQAVDAAASIKVGATILRRAGDGAPLGKADFHAHPEWQLTLPEGVVAEAAVTFDLRATGYESSPAYTLLITNAVNSTATPTSSVIAATPTATATATASMTPTAQLPTPTPPAPCAGDCNEDREVTVDEIVRGVSIALGDTAAAECPALDTNADAMVTVDELVRAIQRALDGCA